MTRRVYVTRVIPQPGIDLLREHAEVEVNESDEPLSAGELRACAHEYDALVTPLTDHVDESVLRAGHGRLQIVANVAVGYDNIDVGAATRHSIMVSNTPGVLTETTADFAWTLLMAVARRVSEAENFLRAGKYQGWGIMMLLGEDIHDKTLGLAGFGRIGQAMARRAAGFNMNVLYYDPVLNGDEVCAQLGARRVDLDTLLRESDFVSVHTPLTPETHHLIGAEQLSMMKPTALLINTSRGPVVDEAALAEALCDRVIAGAALDVFEVEPLPAGSPLWDLPNVLISPHSASTGAVENEVLTDLFIDNFGRLRAGEPLRNLYDTARGY